MGGWGRKSLVVTPSGRVLPCHGATELPLDFWSLAERSLRECWEDAPGMNAYRGEGWMREPCRSCPERTRDFGGCRCQAFALLGDAAATDPACTLSPRHDALVAARDADGAAAGDAFAWRTLR
jgi:pyrroloquinoline quinone biosynthesis protein E